jgi:C-terminal processing protease CtpA/Prc
MSTSIGVSAGRNQLPIIPSEKNELKRCVMHLWRSYDGIGLNLKNSKRDGFMPHIVRDVDIDSPAQYAGVLNNDLIIKVGNRVVEYEKFDTVLKLIKEQLKKNKKIDLVLINQNYYSEFKQKNMQTNNKHIDYNNSVILAQMKYYESPLHNPNTATRINTGTITSTSNYDLPPEPRLCHLLTWPNYDGYGFVVLYNQAGCFVKNVEPNSPAALGGLQAYDRIIEINGKKVKDYKDRDAVMKDINKHKYLTGTGTGLSNKSKHNTVRSQSAYSVGSLSNSNYLNILVCDPNTYDWLINKKIDISARNKTLRIRECFTPPYQELNNSNYNTTTNNSNSNTMIKNNSPSPPQLISPPPAPPLPNDIIKSIILKKCIIRKPKGKEDQPLGFEMTKRGSNAHYISRVEPNSVAALSGLAVDDYLIELNDQNIERDENSLLKEKMFSLLEPKNGGQFSLHTINKTGYDYCVENKIQLGDYLRNNKHVMKYYETPRELDVKPTITQPVITNNKPRICVLRKTPSDRELGFAIARLKNVNEHVINDVVTGSLADRAGLKPNDKLIEVNGENVENKTHSETVSKILDLSRDPNANITLLVVERTPSLSSIPTTSSTTSQTNLVVPSPLPSQPQPQHIVSSSNSYQPPPSINVYPEIKVCEFLGYPVGTQLGLVVTSDNESHDIVKVAVDSPAHKAGLVAGDVIIAVNDVNIEGDSSSIELLNDFSESKPLKVLVATRYTHEWSKLLRIKIIEKDWPNIKRFCTKYIPIDIATNTNNLRKTINTNKLANNTIRPSSASIYSPSTYQDPSGRNILMRNEIITTSNNETYYNADEPYKRRYNNNKVINYRAPSTDDLANGSFNHYNEIPVMNTKYQPNNTTQSRLSKRILTSNSTVQSDQISMMSVLSRSAVDITADGKVLRMCTLILDPLSPNPNDAEFGFDLVTKVGSQRIGDYYIDTIDEDSPACSSGLKSGDRLVEVDGIDVRNKTFEQVVQLINEAKLRCKLRLLVSPSCVINYGNPNIDGSATDNILQKNVTQLPQQTQHFIPINLSQSYQDSRSLPDLTLRNNYATVQQQSNYQHVPHYEKNIYKQKKQSKPSYYMTNDFEGIYVKNTSNLNSLSNLSKSAVNLNHNASSSTSNYHNYNTSRSYLRPVPRLCTLFKNNQLDPIYQTNQSNIGFGVQSKQTSTMIPNFLRVSIVNYKSPAYLAGLDANDFIVEINGRNTLSMSHDEALHFIKSSYDLNNYVKLLCVSEFTYNWLKEHDLLTSMNTDDRSVFSYADYLKNNHRYVPRLCRIRLMPYSKSFGFQLETIEMSPSSTVVSANKAAAYKSFAHVIAKVDKGSAAHASSLRKGDRLIECDGINVEAENEKQIADRIYQAFVSAKQISLFVVDPDTDNYFKSKCIKLHSMLPIVQHITNATDI